MISYPNRAGVVRLTANSTHHMVGSGPARLPQKRGRSSMRNFSTCFTGILVLLLSVLAADVSGKWKAEFTTPDGTQRANTVAFKVDAEKLTGTVAGHRTRPKFRTVRLAETKSPSRQSVRLGPLFNPCCGRPQALAQARLWRACHSRPGRAPNTIAARRPETRSDSR